MITNSASLTAEKRMGIPSFSVIPVYSTVHSVSGFVRMIRSSETLPLRSSGMYSVLTSPEMISPEARFWRKE